MNKRFSQYLNFTFLNNGELNKNSDRLLNQFDYVEKRFENGSIADPTGNHLFFKSSMLMQNFSDMSHEDFMTYLNTGVKYRSRRTAK